MKKFRNKQKVIGVFCNDNSVDDFGIIVDNMYYVDIDGDKHYINVGGSLQWFNDDKLFDTIKDAQQYLRSNGKNCRIVNV